MSSVEKIISQTQFNELQNKVDENTITAINFLGIMGSSMQANE